MEFLTSKEVSLNPGGYLVNTKTGKPVTHSAFVEEQKTAEYIVKLADAIKDKNFTCGKVDDLNAIKAEVLASIKSASVKKYTTELTKPVSKVNDELVKFALDFDKYNDQKAIDDKINELMQQFNTINDVETVGEYFSEGLAKLSKIYTTAEILAAVKINVDKMK